MDVLVSRTDQKGRITYVSDDFARISEFSVEELVGQPHNMIRHPDVPPEIFQDLWYTIQSGRLWNGVVKNRARSGNFYWVDATVAPLKKAGTHVGYISVRRKPSPAQIKQWEQRYRALRNRGSGKRSARPFIDTLTRNVALRYRLRLGIAVGGILFFCYFGLAVIERAEDLIQINRQLDGLRAIHGLGEVSLAVARHRELSIVSAFGLSGFEKDRREIEQTARAALMAMDEESVLEPGTPEGEFYKKIRLKIIALLEPEMAGNDPGILLFEHNATIADILRLGMDVHLSAEHHSESDRVTGRLLKMADMPAYRICESLARLRVNFALFAKTGDEKLLGSNREVVILAREQMRELLNDLKYIEGELPEPGHIRLAFDDAARGVEEVIQLNESPSADPDLFSRVCNRTISSLRIMQKSAEDIARARLNAKRRMVLFSFLFGEGGISLVFALIGLYLISLQSRISGMVMMAVDTASSIASGELTVFRKTHEIQNQEGVSEILKSLRVLSITYWGTVTEIKRSLVRSQNLVETVSASAQFLTESAQAQAAATEEAAGATEQLVAGMDSVAETLRAHAGEVRRIRASAQDLGDFMDVLRAGMEKLKTLGENASHLAGEGRKKSEHAAGAMGMIQDVTEQISTIAMTVENISDRIDLVALNAAIEAARAGEYGRGFSVVAEEVGRLSDQAARSVRDISELARQASESVNSGSGRVTDAMGAFEELLDLVGEMRTSNTGIISTMQEHLDRAGFILESSIRVDSLAKDISSAATEHLAAVREINESIASVSEQTQRVSAEAGRLIELATAARQSLVALWAIVEILTTDA